MKGIRQGFTIIETTVVLAILATILAIGYVSFVSVERRAPLIPSADTFMADMRGQQTKAMTGDTQAGGSNSAYGLYIQPDAYTLFKGTAYNPSYTSNIRMPAADDVAISTAFPGSTIVFSVSNGDVAGFSAGNNTVTFTQIQTGEHIIITVNQYGAVISLQ